MKKTILGLSLLALGLAGAATAQNPAAHADPMGDQTVTKAEAQAKAGDMFAKMDANKDGKLDSADRETHKAQMHGQMFEKLDTNKDGSVSRAEFTAAREQRQGDEGREHRKGMRGGHGGKDRAGGMMLKLADANQDGAVSRDEFVAAHAKMFDMADANKDGKLTAEERKAHHATMRQHMSQLEKGGKDGHAGHGDMPPPPAN
jgi:Ca2+-binding EF-hand superfamily protein